MGPTAVALLLAVPGLLAEVPVADGPELEIDSLVGSVTIEAGEAGSVRVQAEVDGDFAAAATPIRGARGGLATGLRVQSGCATAGSRSLQRCGPGSVRLFLRVPADASVHLTAVRSDVTVRGVTGPIAIDTIAGAIRVRGAGPSVRATSAAGVVTVEGAAVADLRNDLRAGAPRRSASIWRAVRGWILWLASALPGPRRLLAAR